LYILILTFLESRREDKIFGLNGSKHYPNSVSSSFSPESNFDLLMSFGNISTVPHFPRIY
jgi:hypothetical protein